MRTSSIYSRVETYYTEKIRKHGPTARGVDWNGAESQELRFAQLYTLVESDLAASVSDLGCGYGGFLKYARERGFTGPYVGVDLSSEMIEAAQRSQVGDAQAMFKVGATPDAPADFVISSGIFNVRLGVDDASWAHYMRKTVDAMANACRRGIGFNCLSNQRDFSREHLYYADANEWVSHCAMRLGGPVEVRKDYGLYEFTLLARRDDSSDAVARPPDQP